MRILWCSNYSANSAYAQQTRLFTDAIQSAGHHVTLFEISNYQGRPYETDSGIHVVTPGQDAIGNDMILTYAQRFQPDAVITLLDVWRFDMNVWSKLPWYPICPLDHYRPDIGGPPEVMERLKQAQAVIAMSRYGEQEFKRMGLTTYYVPHALDNRIFYPRPETMRQTVRRRMGIPSDAFFACFVGVNDSTPNRKGIPEMLMAWAHHIQKYPNSVLYLHTLQHGNLPVNQIGGVRIDELVKACGIPEQTLRMVDQQRYKSQAIPHDEVADIMSAADVLVLLSRGEGFGVPLIEAQRCGTPVITTNFAGGATVAHTGWLVDYETEWGWQNAFVAKPGVVSATEAFEAAYQEARNPAIRQNALEAGMQYDLDNVMRDYMLPTLDTIAAHVLEKAFA